MSQKCNCYGTTVISTGGGAAILWASLGGSVLGSLIVGVAIGYWIYRNETNKIKEQ